MAVCGRGGLRTDMNFYKRFMADYAKKTSRLTLAQHGAYTLLLDELYTTEAGLPGEYTELYRICRAMNKAEQDAVSFVADRYFPIGEDGLRSNERATQELHLAAPALEAARLNGKKGGRPRIEPTRDEANNPVGFLETTQQDRNRKTPHSPEVIQEANASLSEAKISDCPYDLLIDLYAKHLPTLAQPRKSLWKQGKNGVAMKARWRWVMTAEYEKGERAGTRMATDTDDGLAWFDRFFAYVADSAWLTGKDPASKGWCCDLIWLMNLANFEKVLQGNYENNRAAA